MWTHLSDLETLGGTGKIFIATSSELRGNAKSCTLERTLTLNSFHPPTEVQHALGASFDPNFRGMDGPVQVSIGPHNPDVENAFRGALLNQGVKPIVDASNGDVCESFPGLLAC